jgi:TonB family protein
MPIHRQSNLLFVLGALLLTVLTTHWAAAQVAAVSYQSSPKVVALPEIVLVAYDRAAQKHQPIEPPEEITAQVKAAAEPVGNFDAFMRHLKIRLRYPKADRQAGTQGTVYVQFLVGPDGSLSGAKALNALGQGLDQEVVRAVGEAPRWEPGPATQLEPQRAILPIVFKID